MRFKIVEGSQSGHCCFGLTIVDTTRPKMIGGKQYRDEFESVCECFEDVDASMIVAALNAHNSERE